MQLPRFRLYEGNDDKPKEPTGLFYHLYIREVLALFYEDCGSDYIPLAQSNSIVALNSQLARNCL